MALRVSLTAAFVTAQLFTTTQLRFPTSTRIASLSAMLSRQPRLMMSGAVLTPASKFAS